MSYELVLNHISNEPLGHLQKPYFILNLFADNFYVHVLKCAQTENAALSYKIVVLRCFNVVFIMVVVVVIVDFGPSGVRALPLAAGINEAGHYFSKKGLSLS